MDKRIFALGMLLVLVIIFVFASLTLANMIDPPSDIGEKKIGRVEEVELECKPLCNGLGGTVLKAKACLGLEQLYLFYCSCNVDGRVEVPLNIGCGGGGGPLFLN